MRPGFHRSSTCFNWKPATAFRRSRMANRLHGVLSLFWIFFSLIIGLLSIIDESLAMGMLYIAIVAFSFLTVVYSFCSKCTCRLDSCAHILPGKLTKLLPERKQTHYTFWDALGILIPLAVMLAFPQFWLWKNKILLIIFWLFFLIAIIEIKLSVCKACKNEGCPLSG